jgi:hypothetical protein
MAEAERIEPDWIWIGLDTPGFCGVGSDHRSVPSIGHIGKEQVESRWLDFATEQQI